MKKYIRFCGRIFILTPSWEEFIVKYKYKLKSGVRNNMANLLERNDIVFFDNSDMPFRVLNVPSKKNAINKFYLAYDIDYDGEDMECSIEYMKKHLYQIITHEVIEGSIVYAKAKGKAKNGYRKKNRKEKNK